MRLTSFTDYSLRVLLYLAARPGNRATIGEIAGAFDISENHLMKVAHFLGKADFLVTSRGKHGGLSLARPAEKINLGQLVRLTETRALPAECFDRHTNRCVIAPVCQLKGALMEAVKAFNSVLDRYTLADITGNRDALGKILFIDPPSRHRGRAARPA